MQTLAEAISPCLGLVYKLDLRTITELATDSSLPLPIDSTSQGGGRHRPPDARAGRSFPPTDSPAA